ncbi:MAG TPA: hypothetical protein VFM34_05065 [Moraxellaceae bacterium]|nr:hypothetical protein [Moraxellaceae bacterium]
MKNYQTPRNMANCQFTTGYQIGFVRRRIDWGEVIRGAITCAVMVGIGVMLAWRG